MTNSIINNIYYQIGDGSALYMLGTSKKNLGMEGDKSLIIKKIKNADRINKKKINMLKITLNANDLYDLDFYHLVNITEKNILTYFDNNPLTLLSKINDIFLEDLKPIIQKTLGLDLGFLLIDKYVIKKIGEL